MMLMYKITFTICNHNHCHAEKINLKTSRKLDNRYVKRHRLFARTNFDIDKRACKM